MIIQRTSTIILSVIILSSTALAAEKPYPPEGALLAKQLELAKQLHASELKSAQTALQRMQVASQLSQDAIDSEDPVSKYALFLTAQSLYLEGDDYIGALHAIDSIQNHFQIDALKQKYDILDQAISSRLKNTQYKQIFEQIRPLIEESLLKNDYETARKLGVLAKNTATKTRVRSLELTAREYNLEINSLQSQYEQYLQQQRALKTAPDDKQLNQETGRYLCYVNNNWKEGLKRLALGDNKLSQIARLELQENPDAATVGEAWWDASEKLSSFPAKNVRHHAAIWYQKALPQLEGLVKTDIEQKTAALEPQQDIKVKLVAPVKYARIIAQDKHIGKAGDREEDIVYTLDFAYPIAVNDLRVRFKGQPAKLNQTSNGDIFISIDGGEWLNVSGWSTETSIYSQKFKGWLELSFQTADNKFARQLRVLFQYRSGKEAFVIYHVGCVE